MRIPSLYAVVLNWNLAPDTAECIAALKFAGLPLEQIILVDNGSTDSSLNELVRTFGNDIKYASLAENRGFAGGTNVGIGYALHADAEWVLLINNDTYVSPTFFEELAAALEARPAWRLLSPLILYAGAPEIVWSSGDRRIGPTLLTRSLLRECSVPGDLPAYLAADSLNACAMLVHREVFLRIGGFDEAYFMYAEDADFCWRAQQAGFELGVVTRARMWHKVSRSTGVHHPQSRYWRIRNQIRFYQAHGHGWQKWFLLSFTTARTFLLTIQDVGAGRFSLLRTTWRAWCDGWYSQ